MAYAADKTSDDWVTVASDTMLLIQPKSRGRSFVARRVTVNVCHLTCHRPIIIAHNNVTIARIAQRRVFQTQRCARRSADLRSTYDH
jgi:hypothetical protein